MRTHLAAVQVALISLVVAALAICALCWPSWQDARYLAAERELSGLRASFDRARAEAALRAAISDAGEVPLPAVVRAVPGARRLGLQAAEGAPAIAPLFSVQLATLADIHRFAQPDATTNIASPDPAALGTALAWRLSEAEPAQAGPISLLEVTLHGAQVGAEDVAREREVGPLLRERAQAQAAVERATQRVEAREKVLEVRRKRRMPWKAIKAAIDLRKEAKAELAEKTRAFEQVDAQYQALRRDALAARESAEFSGQAEFALARATLLRGGERVTFELPVPLSVSEAKVPDLRRGQFPALRAAGLWEEVASLDVDGALARVREHFSWHNWGTALGGVRVGGMTLLQVLPCILPVLLWSVRRRALAARSSYSPFTTEEQQALPQVGLKLQVLDWLALLGLPLAACGLAGASLLMIGHWPVLPALSAVACVALGASARSRLKELQRLVSSVVSAHSYPPSAPS